MRRSARRSDAILLVLLAGCASEEPKKQAPASRSAPAAVRPAPEEEAPAEGVVIKGSKPREGASDTARDDAATRNKARIDELKRKAGEGGSTGSWQEFASADGRYKVLFPQPPMLEERALKAQAGPLILHNAVFATKQDKRVFMVSWFERPANSKETDDQLLEAITKGQGMGARGKVAETHAIEQNGHAGRESKIDAANDATMRSRAFVVGARIYQVVAFAPSGNGGSRNVFKFLESFKVTD